jgi:hypothetical protein
VVADANALLQLHKHVEASGQVADTVRIFVDPFGSAWTRIYLPVPDHAVNELQEMQGAGVITLEIEPMPAEDFRATEMSWLQANQEELRHTFPGEWIAIEGQNVVAHAPDLPTLLQAATEAGHPHPFVSLVPAEPPVPFFGCQ